MNKTVLNFIVATALLCMGGVIGMMMQGQYFKGMAAQCDVMLEEAYEAGLSGCVD